MLGLLVGLFHQSGDEIFDHFLDLLEWICCNLCGNCRQDAAVELLCTGAQVLSDACLRLCAQISPELSKSFARLKHSRQVLVGIACDCTTRDDLNCLLDGNDLISPQLLPGFEVRSFLFACCGEICQILDISITS